MSNVYATEPATTARVIFETTHGPLDIKLWCRECPATTRLFLQLCLDGFYDDMLFHRIVPSLLIQTGAIRSGMKSVDMAQYRQEVQAEEALERRQYELNPRIRFNHRGQVAMALEVDSITDVKEMQPQFFITTESAPYLDRKHVVFGTLGAGSPTVFNAIRICGVAVDETTNQPVELEHAPRIVSTKIVESQIHTDLVPRPSVPWRAASEGPKMKKKKKRKGKFDKNVLSFGDEVEDFAPIVKKTKAEKHQDRDYVKACENKPERDEPAPFEQDHSQTTYLSPKEPTSVAEREKEPSTDCKPKRIEDESIDEQSVSAIELRRARFTKKKKSKQEREDETLAKLLKFQGKLKEKVLATTHETVTNGDNSLAARMARRAEGEQTAANKKDDVETYHGQVLHNDTEETGNDWLKTRFKCRRHIDHAAQAKEDAEYEVLDDRTEKPRRKKRSKEGKW